MMANFKLYTYISEKIIHIKDKYRYIKLQMDDSISLENGGYLFNRNNTILQTQDEKMVIDQEVIIKLLKNSFNYSSLNNEELNLYLNDQKNIWDNAWPNSYCDWNNVESNISPRVLPKMLETGMYSNTYSIIISLIIQHGKMSNSMGIISLYIISIILRNPKLYITRAGNSIYKYIELYYEDRYNDNETNNVGFNEDIINELRIFFLVWPEDDPDLCHAIILIAAILCYIKDYGIMNILDISRFNIISRQALASLNNRKSELGFSITENLYDLIGEYLSEDKLSTDVKSYTLVIRNNGSKGISTNLTYRQPIRDRIEFCDRMSILAKTVAFSRLAGNIDGVINGRLTKSFSNFSHSERVTIYTDYYNANPIYDSCRKILITAIAGPSISCMITKHNIEYNKWKIKMKRKYTFEDKVFKPVNLPRIIIAIGYLTAAIIPMLLSVLGNTWFTLHNIDVTSFSTWAILLVTALTYIIRLVTIPEWSWYDIARGLLPILEIGKIGNIEQLELDAFLSIAALYDSGFARNIITNQGSSILTGRARGKTECCTALPASAFYSIGLPIIVGSNGNNWGIPTSFKIDEEDGNIMIYGWNEIGESDYTLHVYNEKFQQKFSGGIVIGSTKVR